jgi:hypothetical protein
MKKFVTAAIAGLGLCLTANSAFAIKPFFDAFTAKYPNVTGAATAKCNTCHEGTDKKMHNAYGKALKELIKKTDAKDTDKINKALDKVAADNAKYGDNLKAGKLPTE